MAIRILKLSGWFIGAATLVLAFNNCGEGFVTPAITARTVASSFFSRAPGETCDDALLRVYAATYHPFVSQTCSSCHIAGPGIGTFAHPNPLTSYNSFMSIGATKISNQALNANHKPPYTGGHNAPMIDSIRTSWIPAQEQYVACIAETGGGGGAIAKTSNKIMPANISPTNYSRIEWDLETESPAKLPLIAGIDVRLAVISGVSRGYEFRNPTLRLKPNATGNYNARVLSLYLNDEMQTDVTTYNNLDITFTGTTNVNLAPGISNALAVFPAAAGDRLAIEFSSLKATTDAPSTNPTPTPTATPIQVRVTYAMLSAPGGIFATSCFNCHSGAGASAGLNLADYNVARNAAANIKVRVNNAANPMPVGGLLAPALRDQISSWVDNGAPQN